MAMRSEHPALMPPLLTAEAMREADRRTMVDFGLPGFTLMENAGRAALDPILRHFGPVAGKTVVCLCGKGNNGGDGFVVARGLHAAGARVYVVALAGAGGMPSDAGLHHRLLERVAETDPHRLVLRPYEDPAILATLPPADLCIDALLGTGTVAGLRPPLPTLVAWLNEQPCPVAALDLPTGLHTDTGAVPDTAVVADLTVAMGAAKPGLFLGEGPRHAGTVVVVEIGIPEAILRAEATRPGCAWHTTDAAVRGLLPTRPHDAHKYTTGTTLVVAGSPGLTGAPVMAAQAAARVGSGFVVCACPEPVAPTLALKLTEVTLVPLPVTAEGGLDPVRAVAALQPALDRARALVVGPGLGTHPHTQAFVRALLAQTARPVVLDADGLQALVGETPAALAARSQGRWVLTPHLGEFRRLAGAPVDVADRIGVAQAYARRWNAVLLLKGAPSVTAAPDGIAWVNRTGNAALATAGTGDVLAGLCGGLLAQGLTPAQAAVCATHLGGAAADRYAAHHSARSMQATDLLEQLPLVLHERFAR
jgi:NAD(P)H-hydrate epimerase